VVLMLMAVSMMIPCNFMAKCCGTCSCGCTFFLVPWIFFFSGAFFPFLVMIPGDLCFGGENVGYRYFNEGNICVDQFNGTGDNTACLIPMDLKENFTIFVNFNAMGMYENFFGACETDHMAALWKSFADSAENITGAYVDEAIEGMEAEMQIKPPLEKVLREAGNSTGKVLRTLMLRMKDKASCSAVSGVYSGFKQAFCCDVLSAIYWSCGSWCLIAWALCCCGIPSSTMGRKRMVGSLWGDQFKDLVHDLEDDGLDAALNSDSDYSDSDFSD